MTSAQVFVFSSRIGPALAADALVTQPLLVAAAVRDEWGVLVRSGPAADALRPNAGLAVGRVVAARVDPDRLLLAVGLDDTPVGCTLAERIHAAAASSRPFAFVVVGLLEIVAGAVVRFFPTALEPHAGGPARGLCFVHDTNVRAADVGARFYARRTLTPASLFADGEARP